MAEAKIEKLFIPGQEKQCHGCRHRTAKPSPNFGYNCDLIALDNYMLIYPKVINNSCSEFRPNFSALLKSKVAWTRKAVISLGLSLPPF